MRLKKASYNYIIGVFILFLSAFSGTISLILSLIYHVNSDGENPLLGVFGNLFAGSKTELALTAVMIVLAIYCGALLLIEGIKRNSLVKPFMILGVSMVPLSLTVIILTFAFMSEDKSFYCFFIRFLRVLPYIGFGTSLIFVAKNKKRSQIPTFILGGLSFIASYLGYGLEKIYFIEKNAFTGYDMLGWFSILFLAFSMALIFLGISLCVASCEYKPTKEDEKKLQSNKNK